MLILSVFSVEVKLNERGADTLITTTQTKQHVEAAPGMLRDNRTGTAQTTSYREQMTETETTTPQNITYRNQKEVKRAVIKLEDRQLLAAAIYSP